MIFNGTTNRQVLYHLLLHMKTRQLSTKTDCICRTECISYLLQFAGIYLLKLSCYTFRTLNSCGYFSSLSGGSTISTISMLMSQSTWGYLCVGTLCSTSVRGFLTALSSSSSVVVMQSYHSLSSRTFSSLGNLSVMPTLYLHKQDTKEKFPFSLLAFGNNYTKWIIHRMCTFMHKHLILVRWHNFSCFNLYYLGIPWFNPYIWFFLLIECAYNGIALLTYVCTLWPGANMRQSGGFFGL